MAVTAGDPSVPVVDAKLGSLVAAHRTTTVYSLLLRLVVAGGAARAAAFDVPAPARVRNDVVGFGVLGHDKSLC